VLSEDSPEGFGCAVEAFNEITVSHQTGCQGIEHGYRTVRAASRRRRIPAAGAAANKPGVAKSAVPRNRPASQRGSLHGVPPTSVTIDGPVGQFGEIRERSIARYFVFGPPVLRVRSTTGPRPGGFKPV